MEREGHLEELKQMGYGLRGSTWRAVIRVAATPFLPLGTSPPTFCL